MKHYLGIWWLCVFLVGCSEKPSFKNGDLFTVEKTELSNVLYFSGTIQPVSSVVLPSPVDGAVMKVFFQYGDVVKPGQALFSISSSKFISDYKAALLDYIKSKNDFDQNKTLLGEAEFLHKNLLISDDDYKAKQSAYYGSQLSYMQSKDALSLFLQQMNIKDIDLYQLSIAQIDKITQAMNVQKDSDNITLNSPAAGVVLSPVRDDNSLVKYISVGDVVKLGDPLVMIGDMQGVSVKFNVNELTINQVKTGQGVSITGIAFPGMVLHGSVTRLDKQGDTSGGGIPTFSVEVSAPLTKEAQTIIHPGMSANISMDIREAACITIPLKALVESNTASFVRVYEPQTKTLKMVAVRTGKTTPTDVEILSGLTPGDKLFVPH